MKPDIMVIVYHLDSGFFNSIVLPAKRTMEMKRVCLFWFGVVIMDANLGLHSLITIVHLFLSEKFQL